MTKQMALSWLKDQHDLAKDNYAINAMNCPGAEEYFLRQEKIIDYLMGLVHDDIQE